MISSDRFYLIPTDTGSREALEIDRLNFDISLIGEQISGKGLEVKCNQVFDWSIPV